MSDEFIRQMARHSDYGSEEEVWTVFRDRFMLKGRCEARGVRKCPCKPWVVASYLLEQSANGVPAQVLVAMLEAISALHDYHNLSNPCATRVVNLALEQVVHPEIARSWDKNERAEWARLPPPVRDAIARRENDRDKELRRLQARAAEAKKRHNGADETVKHKEVEHETLSR